MLIVIDKRIPDQAKENLSAIGRIIEFSTVGITYEAISGHPDIFMCKTPEILVCAPNLPDKYFKLFKRQAIPFAIGKKEVGNQFPDTSAYNCLVTETHIFHKKNHSDSLLLELNKQRRFIDLPQAYTRCSLINLPNGSFITSDKGIEKRVKKNAFDVHYFSPENIRLPGMPHGFIGGALAYYSGKLYVLGNPDFHSWGNRFRALLSNLNIELISLYDGPFFDGGGLFFLD
ncbi:MAG: hypothetical protein JW857_03120 [Bacteroidales bacterium]|nr:hypothetical protein [Bacteroidales bacterium]